MDPFKQYAAESKWSRAQFLAGIGGSAIAGAVPAHALASPALALPPRYSDVDATRHFPIYSLRPPTDIVYTVWSSNSFRGYTIPVGGDVERPLALSITDLRAMPQQTEITRLSCVKGWSAVGKWGGVPLRTILGMVRPMSHTRYVVFHCFDRDPEGTPFYATLDLQEARHPQTMLALDLNDRPIDADHGGPVRLRAPRKTGAKSVKWIRRIDVVASIENIGRGKGGYWEDRD